jgi:AcrR family transcriptional regulator
MATELAPPREPDGEKAARIVEAMRVCVAERGIAGSTFDQVAKAAGVSRGLLHYYFGSKERLLVAAVRRDADVREELLQRALAGAGSVEEVLDVLVTTFEEFLGDARAMAVMRQEIITVAQRNAEIASELAEMGRRTRVHLGEMLRAKAEAGVLAMRDDPEVVAAFLITIADGVLVRRLTEPQFDIRPLMDKAVTAARALLS